MIREAKNKNLRIRIYTIVLGFFAFILIFLLIVCYNLITLIADKPLILRPYYGVGNQLFQYSAAYSFAKETGRKLIILVDRPQKHLKDNESNFHRRYALSKFNIQADVILFQGDSYKINIIYLCYSRIISAFLNFFLSYFGTKIEHVYTHNFFDIIKNPQNNLYLFNDDFESEIFFKKYSDDIKQLFKLKVLDSTKLEKYSSKLNNTNSFCVHVRRGDFNNSLLLYSIDYQKKAIDLVHKILPNSHFYVFSDSIDLVKQELEDLNNIEFISSPDLLPLDDFVLMSSCSNNITANSTFSWWAAYLNPNPNKIIIVPHPRYTDEFLDDCYSDPFVKKHKKELYKNYSYPESWIKVNTINNKNEAPILNN